jgi:hypothetical protein
MTAEERFERIESKHAELTELVARIGHSHIELEAAQLNQQKVHTRLEEIVADLGEKVGDLTILIDTLIKKNLE